MNGDDHLTGIGRLQDLDLPLGDDVEGEILVPDIEEHLSGSHGARLAVRRDAGDVGRRQPREYLIAPDARAEWDRARRGLGCHRILERDRQDTQPAAARNTAGGGSPEPRTPLVA
jgi:hypothetical protein